MVDFGSGQGRSAFETTGVAWLRRGFQKRENAGLGRKMSFMDGHLLKVHQAAMLSQQFQLVAVEQADGAAIDGDQVFGGHLV